MANAIARFIKKIPKFGLQIKISTEGIFHN